MNSVTIGRLFNHLKNSGNDSFNSVYRSESSCAIFDLDEKMSRDEIICYDENEDTVCSIEKKVEDCFSVRVGSVINECFDCEKKYLGYIVGVDNINRTFTTKMKLQGDGRVCEIIFSYDEVDPSEISSIEFGRRVIYIYGRQHVNRTIRNVSKLYFRKEMLWTTKEIEKMKIKAKELFELMSE